jgi:hypothetical protein
MNTAHSQETCVQRGVKSRRAELPTSGPRRCLKRGGRRLAVVAALVIPAVLAGTTWLGTASRAANRTAPVLDRWEVLARDPALLTLQDLAAINLACAEGLPGAAGFEARSVLRTLDEWAARVRDETARHLPKFRQRPGEYQNSEAYFRMLALVTVLQQDCGVRYNPNGCVRAGLQRFPRPLPAWPDARPGRHLCFHAGGLRRCGAAIGLSRLKLVTAKAHLFARWESPDGKECLNLEATSQGLNCFPDDYYHRWPVPMTPLEIAGGQYLKSLTPGRRTRRVPLRPRTLSGGFEPAR